MLTKKSGLAVLLAVTLCASAQPPPAFYTAAVVTGLQFHYNGQEIVATRINRS